MNKDILKKWYFWVIIVLIIAIILVIVLEENKKSSNEKVSTNAIQQENISYTVLKNIFENGGKKKTEKIVINNKDISNDEIEKIYNERKIQNRDVELTIWLFSNEENANNMNNAEIAEASYSESEGIKINNYEAERVAQEKAEKEEAERKKTRRRTKSNGRTREVKRRAKAKGRRRKAKNSKCISR